MSQAHQELVSRLATRVAEYKRAFGCTISDALNRVLLEYQESLKAEEYELFRKAVHREVSRRGGKRAQKMRRIRKKAAEREAERTANREQWLKKKREREAALLVLRRGDPDD